MIVKIHDLSDRNDLKYSVIVCRDCQGQVFVKHKDRKTWEIPGGHIEKGERPLQAAKRELKEETDAQKFMIEPIYDYSVDRGQGATFGRVFYAYIEAYGQGLAHEIKGVQSFEGIPEALTYPDIQPYLLEAVMDYIARRT